MKDFLDFTGIESMQEMRNFLIKVANKSDETTLKEVTAYFGAFRPPISGLYDR